MKEKDISRVFDSLYSKVEKLIIQQKKLDEENKSLKDENAFLRNKLTESKREVKELNEKSKLLKLAKSLSGEGGKSTDLKLKINELVREIDKSIALVNN